MFFLPGWFDESISKIERGSHRKDLRGDREEKKEGQSKQKILYPQRGTKKREYFRVLMKPWKFPLNILYNINQLLNCRWFHNIRVKTFT